MLKIDGFKPSVIDFENSITEPEASTTNEMLSSAENTTEPQNSSVMFDSLQSSYMSANLNSMLAAAPVADKLNYENLSADQKRILENSQLVVVNGTEKKVVTGKQLFDHLKQTDKKALENFIKLTNTLDSEKFTLKENGKTRTALQSIETITNFGKDTITARTTNNQRIAFDDGLNRATVFDYNRLKADEKRVLENSKLTVEVNGEKQVLSGKALFDHLADKNPKALLGFLNISAKLDSAVYTFNVEGSKKTALSYIKSVDFVDQDRFHAVVDPKLKTIIASDTRFSKAPGHGSEFPDSWKENEVAEAGGQTSFSKDGTRVDADIDQFNIKKKGGGFAKIGSVIGHTGEFLIPGKTDPYKINNILVNDQNISVSSDIYDISKPKEAEKFTQSLGE
ncbi:MAG: hypothetical protein JNN15_01305 [Blastocatellia bacterium]|nr:hypothetical protein [Blastocatellia bacterium]